jgi:hypothetical protein
MNTQDFKPFIKSWEEIYALQGELQLMYRPYFKERIANFDINTLEDQELFKKLCWQIVEELTEAMEAKDKNEKDHVLEELIDAFNFMLELYQLYGMAPDFAWGHTYGFRKDIADENFEENILELIKTIGLAANCLKNREWRQLGGLRGETLEHLGNVRYALREHRCHGRQSPGALVVEVSSKSVSH